MTGPRASGATACEARHSGTRDASLSYVIGFGKRKVPLPPGVYVLPSGGGLNVGTMTGQEAPRYRLTLSFYVTNLTNHPNYTNYSGLMTSPFFMQPTVVEGVRRFDLMAAISF